MSVRAIKDTDTSIDKILVSYIDPLQLTRIRKATLLRDYYFECHCTKCHDTRPQAVMFEALVCPDHECGGTVDHKEEGTQCQRCEKVFTDPGYLAEAQRAEEEAVDIMHEEAGHKRMSKNQQFSSRNKVLAPTHVALSGLKSKLFNDEKVHVFGDPEATYELGETLVQIYKWHYPECYPPCGIHHVSQGRLARQLGKHEDALHHYKEDLLYLSATHGLDHYHAKVVEDELSCCSETK